MEYKLEIPVKSLCELNRSLAKTKEWSDPYPSDLINQWSKGLEVLRSGEDILDYDNGCTVIEGAKMVPKLLSFPPSHWVTPSRPRPVPQPMSVPDFEVKIEAD